MFINHTKFNDLINIALNECNRNNCIPSFRLAKILNKRHKNVMRDIREELDREDLQSINTSEMFKLTIGENDNKRIVPYYEISHDGILHLAGRYSRYSYNIRKDMVEEHRRLNLLYKKKS
jgi:hypothetical protein